MIIDNIRKFVLTCPLLNESNDGEIRLNVNYLGDDATTYSLEEIPTEPILKKYIDGSSIRQYQFTFCSREAYGQDTIQNIANSSFYEDFANWIDEQNSNKNLPLLDKKMTSKSIEVLTNGYALQVDENMARYQIDLNLKYYKER